MGEYVNVSGPELGSVIEFGNGPVKAFPKSTIMVLLSTVTDPVIVATTVPVPAGETCAIVKVNVVPAGTVPEPVLFAKVNIPKGTNVKPPMGFAVFVTPVKVRALVPKVNVLVPPTLNVPVVVNVTGVALVDSAANATVKAIAAKPTEIFKSCFIDFLQSARCCCPTV